MSESAAKSAGGTASEVAGKSVGEVAGKSVGGGAGKSVGGGAGRSVGGGEAAARATVLLLVAGVLFGVMAFVTKMCTARLAGGQVAFMRFAVGTAGLGVAAALGVRLRPVNWRGLFLRGLFGGVAVLLFFTSLAHLAVGTTTLLVYTSPVFTAIDSAIFLGERVTRATLAALALTLVGVALVVQGGAAPGHFGFGIWEACGLCSALLSGAAVTAVRAARKTDGPWEIFGAFCLFGMMATGPFAVQQWIPPTPREWLLLVTMGLLSLAAQVLFTVALREIRAAVSGVISQVTPVTALALGVTINHDPLGLLALAGSAITVSGVGLAAWLAASAQAQSARQPPPAPPAPPQSPRPDLGTPPPAALSA